jgi:hypothetical protein
MEENKVITLYLSSWQQRMVKDYYPDLKTIAKITIDYTAKKKVLMYMQLVMYKLPEPFSKVGHWNLYLTDEQIHQLTIESGSKLKFSALFISPELIAEKAIVFS